jgi:hypothetical protein
MSISTIYKPVKLVCNHCGRPLNIQDCMINQTPMAGVIETNGVEDQLRINLRPKQQTKPQTDGRG